MAATALLATVLIPGCGGGVGEVTGTVRHKGKPLGSGSVMFAVPGHPPVTATIDEQGHYSAPGVPTGAAAVAVSSPDPRVQAARAGRKGAGEMTDEDLKDRSKGTPDTQQRPTIDPSKWFPIPEPFADPNKSGLKFDVRPGPNAFDIDLP